MKLDWLRYFTKIEPNKSIRQISTELFISQQTLSSAIQGIEKELECELLIRNKSGNLQFTPEGDLLKLYSIDFLGKLDALKGIKNQSGHLEIIVSTLFARSFFSHKLSTFKKRYPNITFDFHYAAGIEEIINLLSTSIYKIALVSDTIVENEHIINFAALAEKNNLTFTPMKILPLSVMVHHDMVQNTRAIYLSDFSHLPCVIYAQKGADFSLTSKLLTACGCSSPLTFEYMYELYLDNLLNMECYTLTFSDRNSVTYFPAEIISLPLKDNLFLESSLITAKSLSFIEKTFIDFIFNFSPV